jgi:aspartate/tyrosine/aromatic aminotransferase
MFSLLKNNKNNLDDVLNPNNPIHKNSYVGFIKHKWDRGENIEITVLKYNQFLSYDSFSKELKSYERAGWTCHSPFSAESHQEARDKILKKERNMFSMTNVGYSPE